MIKKLMLLSAVCFALVTIEAVSKDVVRMIPKQSEADVSHSYYLQLLELALKATEEEYGETTIELMPTGYNQGIILSLLNYDGILDVVTSAPTPEREIDFRSAKVPLLRGLLGYRMMLIRPEDRELFSNISSADELKKYRACQATHWPDADLLEQAGYKVVRTPEFADLFWLLLDKKCDYFPRGIAEGYAELEKHNKDYADKKLAAFDDIIIHYPIPIFFYTSHKNFELAARIEKGLKRLIINGEFLKLMESHPVTASLFPLSKWKAKRYFKVPNKLLPKAIPIEEKSLWIDLSGKQ